MMKGDTAMTETLNKEAEEVLEVFTEYLNLWHVLDFQDDESFTPIIRADYDYQDSYFEDHPRVLMDHIEADQSTRIIRLHADPMHDEGGPNVLTAFFNNRFEDKVWDLDIVLQYFDTGYAVVYNDGKLTGPDGMVERG